MSSSFAARISVEAVEEGILLAPKFDAHGLIPVITTDVATGEVLMHAYMNEAALFKNYRDRRSPLLQPQPPTALAQRSHQRPGADRAAITD